ncbi:MAG: triose-phosphate isomerase [Ignavibacteria bacterium]|nr:triose-phosphate isomerase [Ignavibacteria bacterium]
MRNKVVAGNWKMNNDINESINLISAIKRDITDSCTNVKVIICPPFTSLDTASTLLKNSNLFLGAQNLHFAESGAYTGEISAEMLKNVGCEYVIIGHSERRTLFNESDELINKKLISALANNLFPIFCIGETLEQREKGITFRVIENQIKLGLKDIDSKEIKNCIIAYEPVWAIGTGKNATPEQAEEVHSFLRATLENLYSKSISDDIIIQYGGSVKPENAKELMQMPNIDGALVGGACLNSDSFIKIIEAANKY